MRSEYCCLPLLHPTKGQKIGNSLNPRQMVTFLIKKLLPEPFRKNVQKTNIPPDFFEAFRTFLNVRLPLEHKEDDASIRLYIYDACRLKKRNRRKEAEAREEKIKNGIPIKKRKGRESTT
ncbi:uncharacterized protein LOC127750450 [Frankliniella occidentalis]|uniref:Uncharacterized protein LOC127750450 n=1 Tax=Frankliniella occidentalis TaxID=133901 RepID=A0A9C6XR47_FRAOC|nr:uncharacterized protein LOC127750450 [Frankliniella occidentalis]